MKSFVINVLGVKLNLLLAEVLIVCVLAGAFAPLFIEKVKQEREQVLRMTNLQEKVSRTSRDGDCLYSENNRLLREAEAVKRQANTEGYIASGEVVFKFVEE